MLPSGPDVWLLGMPPRNKPVAAATVSAPGTVEGASGAEQGSNGVKAAGQQNGTGKAPQASTAALAVQSSSSNLPVVFNGKQVILRSPADAVNALMDAPHPLDMLADPGAYMEKVGRGTWPPTDSANPPMKGIGPTAAHLPCTHPYHVAWTRGPSCIMVWWWCILLL
jgi:hypothetical protein